jgi:glycosyltransferase involved in cell wall biosynthesis
VSQNLANGSTTPIIPDRDLVNTELLPARWLKGERFPITPQYTRRLVRIARSAGATAIHNHGLWLQSNYGSSMAASRTGIPFFSSPRGTLSRWALDHKPLRKRIAWILYQRGALRNARVLFATSDQEAGDLRAAGLRQPIAVIPNGVALGPTAQPRDDQGSARVMLFLSRLHPSKGVLELIKAWAQVAPPGWRLVIAGPNEAGYGRVVDRRIDELGVRRSVELRGEVDDASKSRTYESADVFVLPTQSENFGMVVAEAMAHGLPVITTRSAPWRELETHTAGWWIEPTLAALDSAIRAATTISDEERRAMGARGRQVVAARYGWEKVGADTAAVYRWAISGAEMPSCVIAG